MRYTAALFIVCGLLPSGALWANADYSVHSTLHIQSVSEVENRQMGILDDIRGEKVEPDMTEVEKHVLGSEGNPVRCDMPGGERAYLRRLRCENGFAPSFSRSGSDGFSPWERIMDVYDVQCSWNEKAPKKFTIYMDMYHPNYVEKRSVPGFTIVP